MKNLGYREMLRDRCPKVVDLALKFTKSKNAWVEHTYTHFVKIIGDKVDNESKLIQKAPENKKEIVRALLGIVKGKPKNFIFERSIDWDELTDTNDPKDPNTKVYWKRVTSWVNWFRTNHAYVQNTYDNSKKIGKNDLDIRVEIINTHLSELMPSRDASEEEKQAKYAFVDRLVDFLIKSFEKEYV